MCARPAGAIKSPSECSVCTESRVSKPDSVSKGGPKLWCYMDECNAHQPMSVPSQVCKGELSLT
ncbi:unnamed protein product [Fusarium graminearum]|nr:unnamed protein product [Fusarium graminearum]